MGRNSPWGRGRRAPDGACWDGVTGSATSAGVAMTGGSWQGSPASTRKLRARESREGARGSQSRRGRRHDRVAHPEGAQKGVKGGSKGAQRGLKGGSTRGLKGPWGLGGDTHTLQIYNHIITCLALHLL